MIELVSLFEDSWTDSKWCNNEHVILAIVVPNYFYIALVLIYGWDAPLHCGVEEAGIEWMGAVIGGRKWALSWSLNRPTSPSSFSKDRTSCKNCAAPAERKKQMSTWKVINNCTQKMRDSLRQIAIGKSGQQKQNSFVWIQIYIICRHHCRMKKRDSAKGKRCEGQTFLRCMWSPIHPLSHNKGLVMLRNESITNKNLHLYSKIGRDTIVTFNFSVFENMFAYMYQSNLYTTAFCILCPWPGKFFIPNVNDKLASNWQTCIKLGSFFSYLRHLQESQNVEWPEGQTNWLLQQFKNI